jgi:P4 family phage/plasmid primase-like protien
VTNLLHLALELLEHGYTPLPIAPDGTKRPAIRWKNFITARPTAEQVTDWFTRIDTDGIGIVTGAASSNLEMFEAESRAITENLHLQLAQSMRDHDAHELWQRIANGWVEITPTGGMHWHYRISDGPARPNTKLARRPATPTELQAAPKEKVKVLIETRGQGGFTVIAPSAGRTHPTGNAWVTVAGGPATIPSITSEERDLLYAVANLLDRTPTVEPPPPRTTTGSTPGTRPGDDYNQRASWDDILTDWTRINRAGFTAWRRPGKTDPSISATTGRNTGDNLYVFSSSTEFDTETPYSKFAAYTLLHHGGDYSAAAKALAAQGYGDQRPPERQLSLIVGNAAPTQVGNTALKLDQTGSDIKASVTVTLTDQGNAELLANQHVNHLRYVPTRGQWLNWDGTRWDWCEDDSEAIEAATKTIHSIQPADDAERKHKHSSLSRRALEAAVALGRRDPRIRVRAHELDSNPWALNTPSGTIDLRTGTLAAHRQADLHTKRTGVAYDPDSAPTRWLAFLEQTFDGDTEVIAFVQRLAGYSAAGVVLHHVLPFLHGSGGNGKSVFLDVLVAILGDYASTAPVDFLMANARADESATARLSGLRLVVCSEVNQTARFDEAKVKLLTGGDRLTARFLYGRHFTFEPTHTLWLMGNHQPRVDAGGESFWRRLRLVPFTKTVPLPNRVEGLATSLVESEGPAILAWIVAGAVDAQKGLREPQQVMAATEAYAAEEDALARFISEAVHITGGTTVKVTTSDMRQAYANWCRDEGQKELTPQLFGRELRTRFGIDQTRSHGKRFYLGCSLIARVPDIDDDDPRSVPWSDR